MFRKSTFVAFAMSAVIFTLGQTQADVQVKPFKITGVGYAPDGINLTPGTPGPHWAIGTATELGSYYGGGFLPTAGIHQPHDGRVFQCA